MARRRLTDMEEEEMVVGTPTGAGGEYNPDDLDHMERINAEVQDKGAIYAVLKRRKPDGGYSHLERMAVADFDIEKVKRRYGGGRYMVTYTGQKGSYLQSNTFEIDEIFRPVADEPTPAPSGNGVTVAPTTESAAVARLEGMVAGMMAMMKSQAGAPATPAENPMMTAMQMAREMTGFAAQLAQPRSSSGMGEIIGAVRDVMGLSREMSGEAPAREGDPWDRLIAKGVEPLVELAKQRAGTPAPPAPTLPAVVPGSVMLPTPGQPAPTPAPVGGTPEMVVPPGAPGWVASLARMMPELLRRAEAGKDPSTYAFYYLEERVTGTIDEGHLLRVVKSPTFVQDVLAQAEPVFPQIGLHREWFTEFLEAVKGAYDDEPEAATATDSEGPAAP